MRRRQGPNSTIDFSRRWANNKAYDRQTLALTGMHPWQPAPAMNPSYQPPEQRIDDTPKGMCALEFRLPRIAEQCTTYWGTGDFEPFIASLMMDSRDGGRQGLPWDVAQELLFLLEISIAKRAIIASQTTGMPYRQVFQSMRNNAEEAAKNTANAWSNPTLNNDSKRVGLPGQPLDKSLMLDPNSVSAKRRLSQLAPEKPKRWWQKLLGG